MKKNLIVEFLWRAAALLLTGIIGGWIYAGPVDEASHKLAHYTGCMDAGFVGLFYILPTGFFLTVSSTASLWMHVTGKYRNAAMIASLAGLFVAWFNLSRLNDVTERSAAYRAALYGPALNWGVILFGYGLCLWLLHMFKNHQKRLPQGASSGA